MFRKILICTVLLVTVGACSSSKPSYSGFLGDYRVYDALQPSENSEIYSFETSPTPLKNYDSFIIPPVKIYLNQEARSKDIDPVVLRKLADRFHDEMVEALEGDYKIALVPGEKTAIIRLAITDVDETASVINIIPGIGVGGSTVEAELVDSWTGRTKAAVLTRMQGRKYQYFKGYSSMGHAKGSLSKWVSMFRSRLDELHGK